MTEEEVKAAKKSLYDSKCADLTLRIANALQYGKLVEARKLEAEFDALKAKFEQEAAND